MSGENAVFIASSIYGKRDLKEIKQTLDALHGVTSVSVNTAHDLVSVDYDSSGTSYDEIEHCLNTMGFEIAADASTIHTR